MFKVEIFMGWLAFVEGGESGRGVEALSTSGGLAVVWLKGEQQRLVGAFSASWSV